VSHHVNAIATWDEERGSLRLVDQVVFNARMRRMKPGQGEAFVLRVEREADAKRHHQFKWYFGYIVKQCCARTGYNAKEMDIIFRVEFLPPDVDTLSDLSYEQMADYNVQCEKHAAGVIGVIVVGPREARDYIAA
jgi:hypothetical protein